MQAKQIYFLYAQENQNVAQNIKTQLKSSYLQWHDNAAVETLEKLLATYPKASDSVVVLALISDNFLKSAVCMRALSVFAQEEGYHLLLPVIIPGQRKVDGAMEYYPTSINSIQDTIAYRDFWYDEWIRLRKLGNTLEGEALMALEEEKNFSKRMQPLINPILRYINTAQAKSLEAFQDNNYQILFDALSLGNLTTEERTLPLEEALTIDYTEPKPSTALEASAEDTALTNTVHIAEEFAASVVVETPSAAMPEEILIDDEVLLPQIDMPFELDMDLLSNTTAENIYTAPETSAIETLLEVEETVESNFLATENCESTTVAHTANAVLLKEEMPYSLSQKNETPTLEVLPQIAENTSQNIDQLFALADYYILAQQYQAAADYYEQIIQREPSNAQAFIALATLQAEHLHNIPAAERTFKKLLLSSEENAEIYYEYGLFLQLHIPSQQRRAIELFHAALELDAHLAPAYYALAKAYATTGQKDMAKLNYLQACVLNEDLQEETLDNAFGILRPAKPTIEAVAPVIETPINPNANTVVLVTGATAGIGEATAQKFINEGYKVILTGRRRARLENFKSALAAEVQAQVEILDFDVRQYDKIENYLSALPEDFKNIDILVNNAGLAKGLAPIHEGEWQHWEQMIDTNIKGLLAITRLVSAQMVKNGKGHIINIGSVAGKEAYPNGNVYAATKAAVDMLTRSMRIDLLPHNIRVSAIHPGMVETEFSLVRLEDEAKATKVYDNIQPLTGADIADTIYYVATRPAHVNVQDILIFCTQQASAQIVNRSGKSE